MILSPCSVNREARSCLIHVGREGNTSFILDVLGTFGPVDAAPASDGPIQDIAVSELGTCALTDAGRVYCWGLAGTGSVDRIVGMTINPSDLAPVSGSLAARSIVGSTSVGFAGELCLLAGQASVRCREWKASESSPGWSNGPVFGFTQLQSVVHGGALTGLLGDRRHYCALSTGGNVRCLGFNGFGQLGVGNTSTTTSAVDVPLAVRAESISAGFYSTCAVTEEGHVVCWGNNLNGQLGIGDTNHIGDESGEMPPQPIRFD